MKMETKISAHKKNYNNAKYGKWGILSIIYKDNRKTKKLLLETRKNSDHQCKNINISAQDNPSGKIKALFIECKWL